MKRLLLIAPILCLSACATTPAPTVPAELVGIWASDNAVLKDGKWLTSGEVLYLMDDGKGALVGGPPPIGMKVTASFDSTKNILTVDVIDREKVLRHQTVPYDPNAKTLNIGSSKPLLLTRRSAVIDSSMKKILDPK